MLGSRPSLCQKLLGNKDTCKMLLTAYKDFMDDAVTRSAAFEWVSLVVVLPVVLAKL